MRDPYIRHEVDPSPNHPDGELRRPEAPLRIVVGDTSVTILALVDSGSDLTLLPHPVVEALGISFKTNSVTHVGGLVGQSYTTPIVPVMLELSDGVETLRWNALVGAFDFGDENASGVLGHAGGLEKFTALLDGERRELQLTANARFIRILI